MVRVTDKNYYMDDALIKILDLHIERITSKKAKLDSFIICDGYEGYGKTTMSSAAIYYVAYQTGRKFTEANIFFDIEKMFEFAKSTKEQLIVWDEAALGGMSTELWNKFQIKLIQLLTLARKKRHLWIFNIPRIKRLKGDFIERAMGLIHVYAENEVELGRFCYYKHNQLLAMYERWQKSGIMEYKKYYSIHGTFPDVLELLIDIEAYDKRKDEAIMSIGNREKVSKKELKMRRMLYLLGELHKKLKVKQADVAKAMGTNTNALRKWHEVYKKEALEGDVPAFKPVRNDNITIKGGCQMDDAEEQETDDILLGNGVL